MRNAVLVGVALAMSAGAVGSARGAGQPQIWRVGTFNAKPAELLRVLSFGHDVDAPGEYGCTRLGWAAKEGKYTELPPLLVGGADPNRPCGAKPPLAYLLEQRSRLSEAWLEGIRVLLEAGADPRAKVGKVRVATLLKPPLFDNPKDKDLHAQAAKLLKKHRRKKRTLAVPLRPLLDKGEVETAAAAIYGRSAVWKAGRGRRGPWSWTAELLKDEHALRRVFKALAAREVKPTKGDLRWLGERWELVAREDTAALFGEVLRANRKALLEGDRRLTIWKLVEAKAPSEAIGAAIDAGLDPHQVDGSGETVLSAYAKGRRELADAVRAAAAHGLSQLNPKTLKPVLHEAIEAGDYELVKRLLRVGLDPAIRDGRGRTALMVAASRLTQWENQEGKMDKAAWARLRLARELIRAKGAQLNARDAKGRTAMHYAAAAYDSKFAHGSTAFLRELIKAGGQRSEADVPALNAFVHRLKTFRESLREARRKKREQLARDRAAWEKYLKTPIKPVPGAGESVDYGRGKCHSPRRQCGAACCGMNEICCMNVVGGGACVPSTSSGWINGCPANTRQR